MGLIESEVSTYDGIASELAKCGGVSSVHMWQLRDAHGNERLGVKVTAKIVAELDARGIGIVQNISEKTQWDKVKVYEKKSEVGKMIENLNVMTEKADKKLVSVALAAEALKKIKDII